MEGSVAVTEGGKEELGGRRISELSHATLGCKNSSLCYHKGILSLTHPLLLDLWWLSREQAITIDNWWPVGVCACGHKWDGEYVGECMYSYVCVCVCAHVHACILSVCQCECVLPLAASTPNTLPQYQHPPHPPYPCLSVVWASDWGPWAQSPRKLHQSKQRGGTEPREYSDTKGLPSTVEDFRRDSHKAEPPLSSKAVVDVACCASH